jgi:hypothetical protein
MVVKLIKSTKWNKSEVRCLIGATYGGQLPVKSYITE